MRVVLVIKEARGDVGNERGRVLLKDVEHVASMFRSLENLKSVGLIVTSEPRGLMNPDMAGMVSHSMHTNFQELLETAKAEDEFVDLSLLAKNRLLRIALKMGHCMGGAIDREFSNFVG